MIFGFSEEQLKALGAIFTATEINQQPKLWKRTLEIVEENRSDIKEFLNKKLSEKTRVILTGAGTSDYVGDSIYLHLRKVLGNRVEAIATTDLVSNPMEFIEEDAQTILVSFARSGNSPESVGAYNLFAENVKNISNIVVTCNKDGALATMANENDGNLVILMPEESNDKSFAMTSSFTCMMLAALLLFDIDNLESNKKVVDTIIKQGEDILCNKWNLAKEISDYDAKKIVYLGSGCLCGLGQELALKNLELTSGRVVSVNESILGFRHGPKSITDDETVIIALMSLDKHTKLYDLDLIREIHNDGGNHKLVVIDYKDDEALKDICNKHIAIDGEDVPMVYTCLNYVLFGQLVGMFNSLKLEISPDNPRPDGTVNRVVKGVTIHEYNK